MKKSLTTVVLFIVVIAIWGVISYRIWSQIGSESTTDKQVSFAKQTTASADTLLLNYRNPFVQQTLPRAVKIAPPIHSRRSELKPEPLVSPDFRFKGVLRGHKGRFLMIQKSGHHEVIKTNEPIGEWAVIKVFDDSIRVKRKDKTYTITKS